jgi:hypothetical protein
MKKSIYLLAIAALTAIGFISVLTSCEDEQTKANEVYATSNSCAGCLELKDMDYPLIFWGNFEHAISENNGLFIGFQNENDSVYDFFVLQKEENDYPEMGEITELYLFKKAFYIRSDGEWFMFALQNVEVEKSFSDIVSPENITYGYGVSHNRDPLTESKTVSGLSGYMDHYTSADPNCDSGGEGASACSLNVNGQSCSVECGYGYFACCRHRLLGVVCKCHKK